MSTSPLWLPEASPQTTDTYRWATVTQVSPLRIRLDGDTVALPLTPDSLVPRRLVAVNDRCWVQLFGRRVIIHGYSTPEKLLRTTVIGDVIASSNTGFDCTGGVDAVRDGKWASLYVNVSKTTSDIAASASGNITNLGMGFVKPEWYPAAIVGLHNGASGQMAGGYLDTNGQLVVASTVPNLAWSVGTTISFHTTYALASAL